MLFLFDFLFLYFPVSLFSFLGCSKSVAALQGSLGKSAHSELALFALYWLVVWNSAHSGDDQVESRIWWAAGGSVKSNLVPESRDKCPR